MRPALMLVLFLLVGLTLTPRPAAGQPADLPRHEPDANVERSAVPDVFKWDLTRLFASDEAWQEARRRLARQVEELERDCKGQMEAPEQLARCLERYFEIHDAVNHVTLYANLRLATDQTDDRYRAGHQQALDLMSDLMRRATSLRDRLLALDDAELAAVYAARPDLAEHRPYIDNLRRRRDRVLGTEAEAVLALAGDNLWAEIDLNELPSAVEEAFGALLTDIPWPKVRDESGEVIQLTLANYPRLRASQERDVRREAVDAFLGTLDTFRHAFAALLAGQMERDVLFARARGYETALAAYLDKDALPVEVYDNLVAGVRRNLEPLHRYVALRGRVLGIDEVRLHDMYVPLVASADRKVPFTAAREMILGSLEPLGERYGALAATALDPREGWLDLYPSRAKQSGAFSASVYGRPPYILMNYQARLDDMSTLAHELGHALHSQLAMDAQPYSAFRYVPLVAETASTTNEALLSDYLVERAENRAEKAYLLAERAEAIRTTIYRQTLFAEFERKAHGFVEQGVPVTAELLEQTYADLVRQYYGPHYVLGEHDGMEWAYIPHFYYKYYVYSYALGLSSGLALAEHMRAAGDEAVGDYLAMLEGGGARPPLDLMRGAGVDLSTPRPVDEALAVFARTVDQLEALLTAPR
jgi:oligoendopeptidase F